MTLTARCHSLRPDRHSGWLTYFELAESGPRAAHFLVVGPPVARGPEDVQAALRAGQAAVRYLKEVPTHAPPLTLLEATARILDHESGKTETPLEFGCAVLEGSELWLLTRGSVRLALIAPEPGIPLGADRPYAVSVGAEERYYFGRLEESSGGGPSPDLRARLARGGGGEGGLVLSFAPSDRLREVVPGEDDFEELVEYIPKSAAPVTPASVTPASVTSPANPAATPTSAPVSEPPPPPQDVAPKPPLAPPTRTPEPPRAPEPPRTPEPPRASEPALVPEPQAAMPAPIRVAESPEATRLLAAARERLTAQEPTAVAGRPRRRGSREQSRGLSFWLAVVTAGFSLGALVVYLGFLRPTRPETGPSERSALPAPEASASVATTPKGPTNPRLLWEERFDEAVTSSPVVAGDRVVFGCRDGRVYALDRFEGRRLWSFESPDGFGSSPLWLGDLLILGGYDGTVYALDAATGAARWTVPTKGRITASPVADSTTVYIGSYDHRLYAIDTARGQVRWTRDLGAILWASPAVAQGTVVTAGLDGRLHALDARTGRVRWAAALGAPIHSSPAIEEGTVLVGTKEGTLVGFDLTTGKETWRAQAGSEVNGSPAGHAGWAVVGTESGRVIGVEVATGRVAWRLETGGEVRSRPAFAGDLVWITGYDGILRGVEWRTGKVRISYPAGSSAFSSPAFTGDTVFYGGLDGRFLAVETGIGP